MKCPKENDTTGVPTWIVKGISETDYFKAKADKLEKVIEDIRDFCEIKKIQYNGKSIIADFFTIQQIIDIEEVSK